MYKVIAPTPTTRDVLSSLGLTEVGLTCPPQARGTGPAPLLCCRARSRSRRCLVGDLRVGCESGFSRETVIRRLSVCLSITYLPRERHRKELAHFLLETERSPDLPSANCRLRNASSVAPDSWWFTSSLSSKAGKDK